MTKQMVESVRRNVQVFKNEWFQKVGQEKSLNTIKKRGDQMSEGKQVAVYMQPNDVKRLNKLDLLITPYAKNRSKIIQWALLFADMRIEEFTEFVQGQEAKK